jgi:hypothetical protein
MGHYLNILPANGGEAVGMKIGDNGSSEFLVAQMIAGYAVHPDADRASARKVRQHWVNYMRTRENPGAGLYNLSPRDNLIEALADCTDECGWVRVDHLARKRMDEVACPRLRALVGLGLMCTSFYDWDPEFLVTEALVEGARMGAEGLELAGACWAALAREAANLLREAGPHGRARIG